MGLQTFEPIAVVENSGRGIKIETYQSPLALVMSLLNHGSIGNGCYGSKEHVAALEKVEAHIYEVRQSIAKHNATVEGGAE